MFAYCGNNPVNYADYTGEVTESLAASLWWLIIADGPVPIGDIIFGVALVVGLAIDICLAIEVADKSISYNSKYDFLFDNMIEYKDTNNSDNPDRTYSVYFLCDDFGTIQYVGRVTDDGFRQRMIEHYKTKGLRPKYRVTGLSKSQARGLEEFGMITCHTINQGNPINNAIHGLSLRNFNYNFYQQIANSYLQNKTEEFIYHLFKE